MILYKCIKEFPHGPKLGSYIQKINNSYNFKSHDLDISVTLLENQVEDNPDYFKKVTWLIHSFKNSKGINKGNKYTLNIDLFPDLMYCRNTTTKMTFEA